MRVFNSIASLSSIGHKLVYLSLRATLGNQYSNAEPSAHEAAGGDTTTANHEEADEEDDLPPTAPWLRRQQLRQTERKLEAEGVEPKEEANESAEETKAVKKKRKREKDNGKAKKPSEVEEPEEQAQPVEHERHYTETEQKVEAAEHDTEDEDKGNSDKAEEKKQDWCFRGCGLFFLKFFERERERVLNLFSFVRVSETGFLRDKFESFFL